METKQGGVLITSTNRKLGVTTESRNSWRVRHYVFFQHWSGQNTACQHKHPVHRANIFLLKKDFSPGQSPCDENIPSRKSNFLSLDSIFIKQPSDLNLIFDGFLTRRGGANGIQSVKWLCVFFPYDPPMVFWHWVFCSKLFSLSCLIVFSLQQEHNPLSKESDSTTIY